MNIITINPLSIIPAPFNTRSKIDEEELKKLADNIAAVGIIHTPNCYRDPDGSIICFDGNRRVAAACLLGLPEITVCVTDDNEDGAIVKCISANRNIIKDDALLAAERIAELIDKGHSREEIAGFFGEKVQWVRRHEKLNALDDSIKAFVGKVTLESLERISDLDADKQKKLAKKIDGRVKYSNGNQVTWRELQWDAKSLTADLDDAIFDTADCVGCAERTGADWFADGEEGLGRCLNCDCFNGKCKAHKDALLAEAIPADAEREEVEYRWSLPDEVREEDRKKRDKKHPCAYYWFDGGELTVVWGRSRKTIEAEAEAAKAEREAEREKDAADSERDDSIEEKLIEWMKTDEGEAEIRLTIRRMLNGNADTAADFIIDAICERFSDWWGDISPIIKAFPTFADNAEISEDDAKWYLDRHADEEDED